MHGISYKNIIILNISIEIAYKKNLETKLEKKATKKCKKGLRTARLILPNRYPFIHYYSEPCPYFQYQNNPSIYSEKTIFEISPFEKESIQTKSSHELKAFELNEQDLTSLTSSNSSKNENEESETKNDSNIKNINISNICQESLHFEHVPKFFEIKGKGSLPTISFVKGKIILS